MEESSKIPKKKINLNKDETNNYSGKSSEENLVKDLEESLKNTAEETLDTLHSLLDMVKTKIDDPEVVNEAEKIVNSINKEISNSYIKNINQISSVIKETKVSKTSEEE
jgi:phage pi2 protein 07